MRARNASTWVSSSKMRLMPERLTPSSWLNRWISRSSAMSRAEYRRPRPLVRPGETSPMRSYCRNVCGCMPANVAATEMTKTGVSSLTPVGSSNRKSLTCGHQLRQVCAWVVVLRLCVRRQRGARIVGQVLGHRHFDRDQEVAARAVSAGHALAAHTQGAAISCAGRNLHGDGCATQSRDAHCRAECRFGKRHGQCQGQVVALAPEDVMRMHVHRDDQVARRTAAFARRAL